MSHPQLQPLFDAARERRELSRVLFSAAEGLGRSHLLKSWGAVKRVDVSRGRRDRTAIAQGHQAGAETLGQRVRLTRGEELASRPVEFPHSRAAVRRNLYGEHRPDPQL